MTLSAPIPEIGFGLLGMTWRPEQVPDEQAFAAMKAAVENGGTAWSTATAYGPKDDSTAGIKLIRRYFDRYPGDANKVTLFVRGCWDAATFSPGPVDRKGIRESVDETQRILGDVKKIDIFGPARMDRQNTSVEETISACKELVEEGRIGAVGLSEVSADTIIKAHAVYPITAIEAEFSMWSTQILSNGIAKACKERNIAIWTYAPLGYGFLSGRFTKREDIPAGDLRSIIDRFSEENIDKNLELATQVKQFASEKGVTPAQVALAWIRSYSNSESCGTIMPIPGATGAERVVENCQVVDLSESEKQQLDEVLRSFQVAGDRGVIGGSKYQET